MDKVATGLRPMPCCTGQYGNTNAVGRGER